jgi:hypothetical protein
MSKQYYLFFVAEISDSKLATIDSRALQQRCPLPLGIQMQDMFFATVNSGWVLQDFVTYVEL